MGQKAYILHQQAISYVTPPHVRALYFEWEDVADKEVIDQ
jgi:hypothetical protein